MLWGRNCDRFGPLDFKPKSLQDGWGDDWPISYDDVAPYYDRVEALIGVSGGTQEVPNTPIGKNLLPPFRPRCGELLIKKGAAKLGIPVLPYPLAVLSQPYDDRAPCHYCGACNYGCDTRVALQQFGSAPSQAASETQLHAAHPRCRSPECCWIRIPARLGE